MYNPVITLPAAFDACCGNVLELQCTLPICNLSFFTNAPRPVHSLIFFAVLQIDAQLGYALQVWPNLPQKLRPPITCS